MNDQTNLMNLTASIAAAYLANNAVAAERIGEVVGSIHAALRGCEGEATSEFEPAVDPKKSVKPSHLVSLINGRKFKMLKRHLATNGLTPDEYRQRYGLPNDYPMVAPDYAVTRSVLAKKMGLGTSANKAGATAH